MWRWALHQRRKICDREPLVPAVEAVHGQKHEHAQHVRREGDGALLRTEGAAMLRRLQRERKDTIMAEAARGVSGGGGAPWRGAARRR